MRECPSIAYIPIALIYPKGDRSFIWLDHKYKPKRKESSNQNLTSGEFPSRDIVSKQKKKSKLNSKWEKENSKDQSRYQWTGKQKKNGEKSWKQRLAQDQ